MSATTLPVEIVETDSTPTMYFAVAQTQASLYSCSGKDGDIKIWDKTSREQVGCITRDDRVAMTHLVADSRYLFSVSRFGDLTKHTLKGRLKASLSAPSLSLAGDGTYLYAVTSDRMLTVISKADLKVVARRPVGGFRGFGPAVCCDRDHVYVAASLGEIHVFAKQGFGLVAQTDRGAAARKALVVRDRLYVACGDNRIRVFDKRTLAGLVVLGPEHNVIRAITTDDKYLYSVGYSGTLTARDIFTGEDRLILEHGRDCQSVLTDEQNVYIGLGSCDIMIIDRAALHAAAGRAGLTPPVVKAKVKKPAPNVWWNYEKNR